MDSMLDRQWTPLPAHSNRVDREFISLPDISDFLRLYAKLISLCVLIGLLAAGFYVVTTDRIYTAKAEILIDPKSPYLLQQSTGEVNLSLDTAQIESQMAVMKSEKIANMVIEELKLLDDPRFNSPSNTELLARFEKAVILISLWFGGDPSWLAANPDQARSEPVEEQKFLRRRVAMTIFQNGLVVRRLGVSYAIEIEFSLADPDLASQIVNTMADAFVREQLEAKAVSARQGGEWLEKRLQELRIQMNTATQVAQEFRSRHDYSVAPKSRTQEAESATTDEWDAGITEPTLEELETTADTYRRMYESFLQAYASSVSQQSYPVADARVITPASRPLDASHPRPKLAMAFGGLFGMMLGLGCAFLHYMFDRTVRTHRQIREEVGLECIGEFPSSKGRPEELCYPNARFSQNLRKIRTAISLSDSAHPVRRLGVISAQDIPDKHALVCSLATMYADCGLRVLAIDADVQRPALIEWLLESNQPFDLPTTSIGSRSPHIMPMQNLGFDMMQSLPSGNRRLLEPKTMEKTLKGLASYDMIVVDLPAFASSADNLAATRVLDGVVLVAQAGVTSIAVLKELARSMHANQAPIIGVIIIGGTVKPTPWLSWWGSYLGRKKMSAPTIETLKL